MSNINNRNCQPCTACCEGWLDIQTPIAKAHLGKSCTHCTTQGCGIYESRPHDPCQNFYCAWRQEGSLLPQAMRPDLAGAIVMTDQLQWQGEDVIVAVATGSHMPARTFHWLSSLAHLTSRQMAAVTFDQDANGYNGDFQLRTVGPEAFRQTMSQYFSQKGFSATHVVHHDDNLAHS